MANKIKPIKPGEVSKKKKQDIPDAVFEAFNELITENYNNGVAKIYTKDIVARITAKGFNRNEIFKKGWLDIEDIYDNAGWTVEYDHPGWDENYEEHFTFTDRKTRR